MFSMREFVKTGFLRAVGQMADYAIILNAAGWAEKGVLTEEDLADIQAAIEAHSAAKETQETAADTEYTDDPTPPSEETENGVSETIDGVYDR